ncbi:3-keto-5-aminohexanoate cleavage protein [Acidisoma cladoniae]|uniref:3-keto-5-aminohexanoate cleavage protein n=1 Tax=Acidisoma cladoniae TaxID=3040935 RepID=UPI00254FBE76|nr:3-keto-5-aminohexanoate cleavage protein [Acidisoma sp. PAMC 29798]
MAARTTIITCAITGSIHTPSMSPYLPYREEDIIAQSIAAALAGASVLHLHVRDPETGQPSADPTLFARVVARIRAGCDAVISVTTGGSAQMSLDERLAAPLAICPDLCSLNLGSMNFGLFPMAEKARDWQFDWEKPFLERSKDAIFRNTFADMERIIGLLGERCGTRFEFEAYDSGQLYNLAYMLDKKIVTGTPFVQFVMGILGGIGASVENLVFMKDTATRLFGDAIEWSVLPAGRAQMRLCTVAAVMGGNVRVGLEDNLWSGPGALSTSNAEQVEAIQQLLGTLFLETASPDQVRQRLELKRG